jgi:hypothetical protein
MAHNSDTPQTTPPPPEGSPCRGEKGGQILTNQHGRLGLRDYENIGEDRTDDAFDRSNPIVIDEES